MKELFKISVAVFWNQPHAIGNLQSNSIDGLLYSLLLVVRTRLAFYALQLDDERQILTNAPHQLVKAIEFSSNCELVIFDLISQQRYSLDCRCGVKSHFTVIGTILAQTSMASTGWPVGLTAPPCSSFGYIGAVLRFSLLSLPLLVWGQLKMPAYARVFVAIAD